MPSSVCPKTADPLQTVVRLNKIKDKEIFATKLLGLSCGTKLGRRHMGREIGGNTEALIKEVLMGAEELGVDVEFVRLLDLDIRPCRFCKTCLRWEKGPEGWGVMWPRL